MLTVYALPYMKKQNYGRIVNVGSATGANGMPHFGAYAANKEAIRAFTRVCAKEVGSFGITCNTVCPSGMTETGKAWAEAHPEEYKASTAGIPLGRIGDPETDLAPVIAFLCSDDAQYLTGQTIGVDGGLTSMS